MRNQAMKNMQFTQIILILTITINSSDGGYIHPMEEEEYEVIKKFVIEDFNVPVFERTRLQKALSLNFGDWKPSLGYMTKGIFRTKARGS